MQILDFNSNYNNYLIQILFFLFSCLTIFSICTFKLSKTLSNGNSISILKYFKVISDGYNKGMSCKYTTKKEKKDIFLHFSYHHFHDFFSIVCLQIVRSIYLVRKKLGTKNSFFCFVCLLAFACQRAVCLFRNNATSSTTSF